MAILADQMRVEKEREAELDAMFQDEAAHEWRKRTDEWDREREARESLMAQVLAERARQLDEKLALVKERRADVLAKREELLDDMERTNAVAITERERLVEAKELRRRDELAHIEQLRTQRDESQLVDQVEMYEREQMERKQEERFVAEEKAKLAETKFQPKVA